MCVFFTLCLHVCVWTCLCLSVALTPRAKNQWWWNLSTVHFFIQRKDCFLSELRKRNTFLTTCISHLSVITKLDVLVVPTCFVCFISCVSDPLNFSKSIPSSVFCLFQLWCVFLFCWTHCWSLHVEYSKELYHIMETQAVRMTSSCHKVFYVSLRVLTLSILFSTTTSQQSLFCDIMFKQGKKSEREQESEQKILWN